MRMIEKLNKEWKRWSKKNKCYICGDDISFEYRWNEKELCSRECQEKLKERCQEYDISHLLK